MIRLILEAVKEWVEETLISFKAMYLGYVTPQMYGAKADGVTDDTQAIQSALNKGGVVYFPQGIYNVLEAGLEIKSNTTIIGEGQSVVKIDDAFSTQQVNLFDIGKAGGSTIASNVVIEGLTFRGSEIYGSDSGGLTLLAIWGASNIVIRDCLFQNNMYQAVRLLPHAYNGVVNGCNNITVLNSRFEAVDCGVVSGDAPANDVIIRGCYFSGLSTLNNFTNFKSEPIGTYLNTNLESPNTRWVIEDCIFEHKVTAAIHINIADHSITNIIANKDFSVRNCTFRNVTSAVTVRNAENVSVDGIFVDSTDNIKTEIPMAIISLYNSNNVTVKNITSDSKQLNSAFVISNVSELLIDGVDSYTDVTLSSNNSPYVVINSADKCTLKNFYLKPIDENNKRTTIQLDGTVTNSYFNIAGNSNNGSEVEYYLKNIDNIHANTFIVDTDNNASRKVTNLTYANHDNNTWTRIGNHTSSTRTLNQINKYYLANINNITFRTQTELDNAMAITDFYLLNEGSEVILEFANHSFTTGKSFTFATGGNILAIPRSFAFSDDYKVVCHFKQINGKWVESQRLLEYYEGATVDVTDADPTDIDFTESGDLVIKGTDGTMRKIVFNQDGTCSWATLS